MRSIIHITGWDIEKKESIVSTLKSWLGPKGTCPARIPPLRCTGSLVEYEQHPFDMSRRGPSLKTYVCDRCYFTCYAENIEQAANKKVMNQSVINAWVSRVATDPQLRRKFNYVKITPTKQEASPFVFPL